MNVQELLWKYAGGECSPKEKAEVETLLVTDAALRHELELIQEAHAALKNMVPEQPSMRFTQNVMEALPNLYSAISAEPLIKPFWKKAFWIAAAGVFAAMVYFSRLLQPSSQTELPLADKVTDTISSTFQQIPEVAMQYFVMLLLAVATLAILDKAVGINKWHKSER